MASDDFDDTFTENFAPIPWEFRKAIVHLVSITMPAPDLDDNGIPR